MKISEKLKEKTLVEYVISVLSFLIGSFLFFHSIYFIYLYHFVGGLFLYMYPMTNLVIWLVISLFLVLSSSCFVLFNNRLGISLYRFSSVIIIFYPINENLILFIRDYWYWNKGMLIICLIIIAIGVFLYCFFYQKRYPKNEKLKKYILLLGAFLYLCIDIIFFNWYYF